MTVVKCMPNKDFFTQVEELLQAHLSVTIKVQGTSMHPFLRNGKDRVVLDSCAPESLKIGDVVLFRYHGRHLLHRIIAINNEGFVIKGDGNLVGQEQCQAGDIVGKMTSVIKFGGAIWDADSSQWQRRWHIWQKTIPYHRIVLAICRRLWRK